MLQPSAAQASTSQPHTQAVLTTSCFCWSHCFQSNKQMQEMVELLFFWWPVLFFPIPPGSGLQESKESHRFEVQRSQRWTRLSRNLRACLRRLNVIDYTSQATDQMRSSSPAVGSRPKAETAWVVKNWSFLGGKELWKCVSKRHDSTHTARACPPPVLSFLLLNVLFRCVDSLAGRC